MHGGIEAILQTLEEHEYDTGIVTEGCYALAMLAHKFGKFCLFLHYLVILNSSQNKCRFG